MSASVDFKFNQELAIDITINCDKCGSEMDTSVTNNKYRRTDNSIEISALCLCCQKELTFATEYAETMDITIAELRDEIKQLIAEKEQLQNTNVFNWLEDKLRAI